MSGSNPFRRDRPFAQSSTSAPSSREDGRIDASVRFPPLNIDTSAARTTTQTKHVQFASPPAPETPLSYSYPSSSTSSPESSRHTGPPTPYFTRSSVEVPVLADPFLSDGSDASNGRSHEGNTQDADTEAAVTTNAAEHGPDWPPFELHSSSGKVVATSEAPSADGSSETRSTLRQALGQGKQVIDVDAFKRLILTGESGTVPSSGAAVPIVSAAHPMLHGDSSSSTADSASVSRQSIFEPVPSTSTETPRTSHELDVDDATVERRSLSSSVAPQARQKPSLPRTKHGKRLTEPNPATSLALTDVRIESTPLTMVPTHTSQSLTTSPTKDLNKPLPLPPPTSTDMVSPTGQDDRPELGLSFLPGMKRPPTPPLTRRQSQLKSTKPQLARSNSLRTSVVEHASPSPTIDLQTFPSTMKPVLPPPPPQRRLNRASTYGAPSAEPQLPINDTSRRPSGTSLAEAHTGTDTRFHQPVDLPSRTPSSVRRASASLTGTALPGAPPPLPPPRRMRGSSKSSVEIQKPASCDLRRPSTESSRDVSRTSNATDILADLAALQKEVDALRNSHGGRRVS